jgi:hypothetical protein
VSDANASGPRSSAVGADRRARQAGGAAGIAAFAAFGALAGDAARRGFDVAALIAAGLSALAALATAWAIR